MSSGGKQLKINTRERLISNDHNRLQAFVDAELSEVLRRLYDNRLGTVPFNFGGGVRELGSFVDTDDQDSSGIGTPLRGDVLEGLVVLPQASSLNLLVSPGAVLLDDPDGQTGSSQATPASPDDSRGKLVIDPGIVSGGILTLAAGSGGGIRIDVIECRRRQVVTETDSRDVFDPGTNTFAPQVVDKVIESQLEYRVRQGVAGAGLPANVQGWLPLCIASVPSAAVNVDTITFWDVRPLIKDRISFDQQHALTAVENGSTFGVRAPYLLVQTNPATLPAKGYLTNRFLMYRAGGWIDLDLADPVNHATGFSPTANVMWFLKAAFFGSLPRWVNYAASPAARLPSGPLGVLVVSGIDSTDQNGLLSSVSAPASTGLSAVGQGVILAAAFGVDYSPGINLQAVTVVDGMHHFQYSPLILPNADAAVNFQLIAGSDYPMSAKSLLIRRTARFTMTAATAFNVEVSTVLIDPGTINFLFFNRGFRFQAIGQGVTQIEFSDVTEVPIIPYLDLSGAISKNVKLGPSYGSGTAGSVRTYNDLQIIGWRL